MFITQALVENIVFKRDCVLVDFKIEDETFEQKFSKEKIWKNLRKGQKIQVNVIFPEKEKPLYYGGCNCFPVLHIIPTFFDSKQRCKKCGRFYKLYCKYCYERSKTLRAILDVFEEVLNVTDFKKVK